MAPHKGTVRTYSLITSNNRSLLEKARKLKTMEQDYKICEFEPIFSFIKLKNGKYTIILGKYRVTGREFDKITEAEEYVKAKPYELLINCAVAALKSIEENEKSTKKMVEKDAKENV